MSHIFDALQRSESERTGIDMVALSAAALLLEVAERDAAANNENVVQPETTVQPGISARRDIPTHTESAPPPPAAESPVAADLSRNDAGAFDQFTRFQSLRVLVSPQSRLVTLTDQESLAAEKFRFLTVRLRHLQQNRLLKKVLVTSTIPQEGKTTAAANLACALARRTQQKTLLLEGDLRRPSLAQLFGLGKTLGVSEWLQGECSPTSCIYHLEGPGLWLLPSGAVPRNPVEIMQSGRLSSLMDQLTAWFDWIVIDSPPVLPLGDTSIWMRSADGILLIARQGVSEKKQLRRGLEVLERSKLLGTLLNCSATSAHGDYYYHYGHSATSATDGHPKN
jgi:capsular exopolysaccharide synthesis family protein